MVDEVIGNSVQIMKRQGNIINHKDRSPKSISPLSARLLDWYDHNARVLPWRSARGERADPYRVWLSEIMLQQTVVKAVIPYFETFVSAFPSVKHLAQADREDVLRLWAGLGYYSRARNLYACAQMVVERHAGRFPDEVEALRALPGIGAYTAGAIAAIAFGKPEAAIDGNVERVVSRLDAIKTALPLSKPAIRARVEALIPNDRPGDFAQALMDLGATICIPKNPRCDICPWTKTCKARAEGEPTLYPLKAPKIKKPQRYGAAFVARRKDGAVLVLTRPDKGLLGGMTGVPTTEWTASQPDEAALHAAMPFQAPWKKRAVPVTHVFTHFALSLDVYDAAIAQSKKAPPAHRWSSANGPEGEALPTLFRKVVAGGV